MFAEQTAPLGVCGEFAMEMGLGFAIGSAVGAGVGFLIVMLVIALRRGHQKMSSATTVISPRLPQEMGKAAEKSATGIRAKVAGATRSIDRETKFFEVMGDKENKLGKAVHEVRDLVLKVADIVSRTNDASGEAARAFNSAKTNLDSIDFSDSENLLAAHAILLSEINSVIGTNEKLQNELESAKIGIAEQRRQIEELRTAVRIDSLTQLPNRAAFDERLNEFLKRLDRTSEVFSLLLLDIDHFKKVNDTYGHVNGDRILKGVATKIKANIRTNDIPARYGGEEFAVLLPNTNLQTAESVADRMRQDIAKTIFKLDNNDIRVTISGGLAECCKGLSAEKLIGNADQALYKSKGEGRNRITTQEC